MKRVLFITDDPHSAAVFSTALQRTDELEVITVLSLNDALNIVRSVKPDVILIDLSFRPSAIGEDIGFMLRSELDTGTIPIIFLVDHVIASKSEADRYNSRRIGDYILSRPTSPSDLRSLIKSIPT